MRTLLLAVMIAGCRAPATQVLLQPPDPDELRRVVAHEVHIQFSAIEARRRYPALADIDSPLLEAVKAQEDTLRDNGDPLLDDDDWPLTLAEREAERLGILPRW